MAWAPERSVDQLAVNPPPAGLRLIQGGLAGYVTATPLQVLRGLATTMHGLSEREAQDRLIRLGDNEVTFARPPGLGSRLIAAARSPFVVVLVCLAAVSASTSDPVGGSVIATLALISCLLRAHQEHSSDRAAATLRAMVATTATVVRRPAEGRPGVDRELPVDKLVPGPRRPLALSRPGTKAHGVASLAELRNYMN